MTIVVSGWRENSMAVPVLLGIARARDRPSCWKRQIRVFNSTDAFTGQFIPTDGGYLYYPSAKSGGKLITRREYDALVRDRNRVSGPAGQWKMTGITILIMLVWTIVSMALELPEWATSIVIAACVIGFVGRVLWVSLAPQRLVRDRPAVTPPRDLAERRKHARALLGWPLVIAVLLISGAILYGSILSPKDDFWSWAWLAGSGVMFVGYLWIAVQKMRDR